MDLKSVKHKDFVPMKVTAKIELANLFQSI